MAGPTTAIEIQSTASQYLGQKGFATIVDSNEFAVSLQSFYDMLIPDLLTESHWKFSKKYVQLSESSTEVPDLSLYTTAYALPADYLMAIRTVPNVHYDIFGGFIYTGTSGELKLEYVYESAVTAWSPKFKRFASLTLASELALSVAESSSIATYFDKKAQKVRAEAMWADAQSSTSKRIFSNPWVTARSTGSYLGSRFAGY